MAKESKDNRSIEEIIAEADAIFAKRVDKPNREWKSPKGRFSLGLNPFPLASIGSLRSLRLNLGIGSILFFALSWVAGSLLWDMRDYIGNKTYGESVRLTDLSSSLESSPVLFGLGFALLVLLSVLIHEAGHGLGYVLTGRRWVSLNLSLGGASVTASAPATNSYQQLLTTVLGGGFQVALGFITLLFLGGPGWTLFQMVAVISMFVGTVALLIPVSSNSDGAKFWIHLIRIVIGRGGKPLNPNDEYPLSTETEDRP